MKFLLLLVLFASVAVIASVVDDSNTRSQFPEPIFNPSSLSKNASSPRSSETRDVEDFDGFQYSNDNSDFEKQPHNEPISDPSRPSESASNSSLSESLDAEDSVGLPYSTIDFSKAKSLVKISPVFIKMGTVILSWFVFTAVSHIYDIDICSGPNISIITISTLLFLSMIGYLEALHVFLSLSKEIGVASNRRLLINGMRFLDIYASGTKCLYSMLALKEFCLEETSCFWIWNFEVDLIRKGICVQLIVAIIAIVMHNLLEFDLHS